MKLDVFSVKLNICKDPPKVKELLKILTPRKTQKTFTTANKVNTGNQPKNKPVKRIGKKKTLFTIVRLLRQLQPDIQQMLIETNIVLLELHLMQISPVFRGKTFHLMKIPQKA